ncbi:MAG: hypothetical protein RIF33_10965 [Cyclobacteriaceae bacterium]
MRYIQAIFIGILLLTSYFTTAQERVAPSKYYKAGEAINAPTLGVGIMIPNGWVGYLPQETEIFILTKENNEGSEVYAFGRENTYDQIEQNWKTGLSLSPSISIIVREEIQRQGELRYANIEFTGTGGGQRRGLAVASCGDYGICTTWLLLSANKSFDDNKTMLLQLVADVDYSQPKSLAELQPDLDWNSELEGKYLYSKKNQGGQKTVFQLWLNGDHTFASKAVPMEWTDGNKKYSGKKKGAWSITKRGGQDLLVLNYGKLEPVILSLSKSAEELLINEQSMFVNNSN